jgi:histidine triad (HIT) family protein
MTNGANETNVPIVPRVTRRIAMSATFDDNCIFCKIARGDFETEFVAENERCVAFRDINPHAPVHVLVVPRDHIASVTELRDREISADLLFLCADVARKFDVADSGFRVMTNTGPDAGQSVDHLHMHVVGGKKLGIGID